MLITLESVCMVSSPNAGTSASDPDGLRFAYLQFLLDTAAGKFRFRDVIKPF